MAYITGGKDLLTLIIIIIIIILAEVNKSRV